MRYSTAFISYCEWNAAVCDEFALEFDMKFNSSKIVALTVGSRCNPWAVGWSPEGTFKGFVWGK